jgi:hypothetical protein
MNPKKVFQRPTTKYVLPLFSGSLDRRKEFVADVIRFENKGELSNLYPLSKTVAYRSSILKELAFTRVMINETFEA